MIKGIEDQDRNPKSKNSSRQIEGTQVKDA
jgi:hypothetical protein